MLGHETSLGKFKKTELRPSIFSDYKGTELEYSITRRNTWRLNHSLPNNGVNQAVKEEINKHMETNENENITV